MLKKHFPKIIIFFLAKFALIFILWLCLALFPYPYKDKSLLSNISFSRQVFDRQGNLLRLTLSEDEKYRIYGKLQEINPVLHEAVLLYEDKYFYSHFGVNPLSLFRAFYETYVKKSRTVGASTLTMQTARLVFKLKTNTLEGKLNQIWKALQLEYYHTKEEILEAYFNLAPYGGNIEGIFAASQIYFHDIPYSLNLSESLALVTIPQNPEARKPSGKDFNYVRSLFKEKWLEKYPQYSYADLPLKTYNQAEIPFIAPHFTQRLLENSSEDFIFSSLNTYAQKNIEESIKIFTQRHRMYGINNAAALLVHAPTMQVHAYVGSADYFNEKIEGQVDALKSRRSPGSTLKPFIYALALDQGLIHEGTILLDIPQSFQGYNPENFNREYSGPVPAGQALRLSRNIPAIYLASKINNPDLYDFLLKANVNLKETREHYGLSLVLGGAELSPTEIASLYAMLLNQGLYEDLNFLKENNKGNNKENSFFSLLSKEASAVTLKMLENPLYMLNVRGQNITLRLKTGTSNGFRDAWAVGTFGEYILLVWIGNFDNSSNPHFIGTDTAIPLFIDIANGLSREINLQDPLLQQIKDLPIKLIDVCTDTGDINTELCKNKSHSQIYYIAGKSPIRDTGILRPILIDSRTNLRVCRKTLENQNFIKEEVGEFWSSEMQKYFQQAGIYKEAPPVFELNSFLDPLCQESINFQQSTGAAPTILIPKEGIIYHITNENREILLSGQVNYDSAWLYWFVNSQFIGKTQNNEVLKYAPTSEVIEIIALDSFGRSTTKKFDIKF